MNVAHINVLNEIREHVQSGDLYKYRYVKEGDVGHLEKVGGGWQILYWIIGLFHDRAIHAVFQEIRAIHTETDKDPLLPEGISKLLKYDTWVWVQNIANQTEDSRLTTEVADKFFSLCKDIPDYTPPEIPPLVEKAEVIDEPPSDIVDCRGMSHEAIVGYVRSHPGIKKLSLSGSQVTDKTIEAIKENCRELEFLSLARCALLKGDTIAKFCRDCHSLKEVDVSHTQISDDNFLLIAKKASTINCSGCKKLSDAGIAYCIDLNGNIVDLNVSNTEAAAKTLMSLGIAGKRMVGFKCANCRKMNVKDLNDAISKCPNLQKLVISGTSANRETLKAISKKLTEFACDYCYTFKDQEMADFVESQPTLKFLSVSNTNCNKVTLEKMATSCPDLELFNCSYCQSNDGTNFDKIFDKCKKLKEVNVDGLPFIGHNFLKGAAMSKSLRKLICSQPLRDIASSYPQLRNKLGF